MTASTWAIYVLQTTWSCLELVIMRMLMLINMLKELKEALQAVKLQMNLGKTRIMTSYNTQIILENINIEMVDEPRP